MEGEELNAIVQALQRPVTRTPPRSEWSGLQRAVDSGFLLAYQLEDYLLHYESRMHGLPLSSLCDAWDIPLQWVTHRPKYPKADYMLQAALLPADAACLMIMLEALGFTVDPGPLVQRVVPALAQRELLSGSEWECVRYERMRGRLLVRLSAQTDQDTAVGATEGSWRDSHGRRYTTTTSAAGKVLRLKVIGPRYKPPVEEVLVTCDYCGFQHLTGNRESQDNHRREHRRAKKLLEPAPLPEFARRLAKGQEAEIVMVDAPKWMHDAVYERALRFKRDFGYDAVQWTGDTTRKNTSRRWQGWLFAAEDAEPGVIAGACAFYLAPGEDSIPDRWTLQWVWIAPPFRGKGILRRRWPGFIERYGDFLVEPPYSAAMHACLLKHGTPAQRELAQRMGGTAVPKAERAARA